MGLRQPWHWIVLIVVLLLLFGAKRLPDLARGVGQSLKIFKKEIKDLQDDPATPPSATTGTPEASTTAPTTAAPAKEPDPQPAVPDSKDNA